MAKINYLEATAYLITSENCPDAVVITDKFEYALGIYADNFLNAYNIRSLRVTDKSKKVGISYSTILVDPRLKIRTKNIHEPILL